VRERHKGGYRIQVHRLAKLLMMPAAIVHSTNPALPLEIVIQIISHVSQDNSNPQVVQEALRACTLISRVWYAAAVRLLYERPYITGSNYEDFVATICPSINAHIRKNGLAELVRSLDLCRLIHHGSRSLTARLLGRVKNNIERFVAPQASFGYARRMRWRVLADVL